MMQRKIVQYPTKPLLFNSAEVRPFTARPEIKTSEELKEQLETGLHYKLRRILNLDIVLSKQENYQKHLQVLQPQKIYNAGYSKELVAEYDTQTISTIMRRLGLDNAENHQVFDIIFSRPINNYFKNSTSCRIEKSQETYIQNQLAKISDITLRDKAQNFVRELYGAAFWPEKLLQSKFQEYLKLLSPIMLNILAKDYNIHLGPHYQNDFLHVLVNLCLTKNYINLNPLQPPYASFDLNNRIFAGLTPEPSLIKNIIIKRKLYYLIQQLCFPDKKISPTIFRQPLPILPILNIATVKQPIFNQGS